MADKKKKKGSAFEYEAIGKVVPDGYVMVRNPDGTIKFVPPKKKNEKK